MSRAQAFPDFLSRKAPPNYIAGLGRGASGFTTRSDIGPARETEDQPIVPPQDQEEQSERFQDPENETGLFASLPYTEEDDEADRIYEEIERKMDERRKSRREQREKEEKERLRKEQPKIQEQFADLKRGLSSLSQNDWEGIPDVGDLVRKKGKVQKAPDTFTPVTDSILFAGRQSLGYDTALDINEPTESDGAITDLRQFGQARDKILTLKLDQAADSASGQTNIDPKGYLTDLNSVNIKSESEISDIKKGRTLLKSVITSNPKHAPGWIAAARLEEVAGKIVNARNLIAKGCEECPDNEDIWLESARLNTPDNAKVILANSIRHNPTSVKIWIQATELEKDIKLKKKVLRRALEFIPNSLTIWKELISLEDDAEDVKILLSRAVDCVPLSVELWLALARLETYDRAKIVLNKARVAIPTSHEIWISACKLEENHGNAKMVDTIISRAITILNQKGFTLEREQWIVEAQKCETDNAPLTCQSIIRATIEMGLEEEDFKSSWMEDAEKCTQSGHFITARAIYAHAIKVFPQKKGVWRRAAVFESAHGTPQALNEVLELSTQNCPNAPVLWLMRAKSQWKSGDIQKARSILESAFASNPESEQIWLAAIKLEIESQEYERGRALLSSARQVCGTERVWMKSTLLERQLKNIDKALELVETALSLFPQSEKLYMIKGQIQSEENGDIHGARETYTKATKSCPKCQTLWIQASRLEEKSGMIIKARAILEKARVHNPKSDQVWLEAIRLEMRNGNAPMAQALLSKSLQECPTSGILWSEAILLETRPKRKARSADALKKYENDPHIVIAVARLFWAERKLDKARDAWAWLYRFEMQHGDESSLKTVINECVAAEPKYGELWQPIAKDMKNVVLSCGDILKLVSSNCSEHV